MKQYTKQSKTYGQLATGLLVAVPLVFPFSQKLAAGFLILVATSLLAALIFHNHDE